MPSLLRQKLLKHPNKDLSLGLFNLAVTIGLLYRGGQQPAGVSGRLIEI